MFNLGLYLIIQIIHIIYQIFHMFNPNSFFGSSYLPNSNMYEKISDNILSKNYKTIQINKVESPRTRWQQPFVLPVVLYKKFNLPLPEEIAKLQNNKQKQYPPQLLDFVKRCYETCSNEAENKRMELMLKKIVKQAQNHLFQIDWSKYQVPNLPKLYNQPTYQPILPTTITPIAIQPIQKKQQVFYIPAPIKINIPKIEIKQIKASNKLSTIHLKAQDLPDVDHKKKLQRLNRFKGAERLIEKKQNFQDFDFQKITDDWKIVGTSQQLEKKYLRITSMPDPTTVRPEKVLKKVLTFLLDKYNKGEPYQYIIQQFRSLRQDLTIQHIKNSFTAEVYEQNSKISLFSDDYGQFKQCQSVLWDLYKNNIYRDANIKNKFIGYQLLGLIIQQKHQQLQYTLTLLSNQQLQSKEIQDILKLKRILLIGNYAEFFKFYSSRDALCRCLLNQYIDQVRAACIAMISKTFGEKIKLQLLANLLQDDYQILEQLIIEIGGVIREGDFMLKQSYEQIRNCEYLLVKKKNAYLV